MAKSERRVPTYRGSALRLVGLGFDQQVVAIVTGKFVVGAEPVVPVPDPRLSEAPLTSAEWRFALDHMCRRHTLRPTTEFATDLAALAQARRASAMWRQSPEAARDDHHWEAQTQELLWLTGLAIRHMRAEKRPLFVWRPRRSSRPSAIRR